MMPKKFRRKFYFHLVIISALVQLCATCLFQKLGQKTKNVDQFWNDKGPFERKQNSSCECGTPAKQGSNPEDKNHLSPWLIFLHMHYPEDSWVCTGVVLASNLIATSHSCLVLWDDSTNTRVMNPYDTWHLAKAKRNVVSEENVMILPTSDFTSSAESYKQFHVKKIIYSAQYGFTQSQSVRISNKRDESDESEGNGESGERTSESDELINALPQSDVALILVHGDLTQNNLHIPICLPRFENVGDEEKNLVNREALYVGVDVQAETQKSGDIEVKRYGRTIPLIDCSGDGEVLWDEDEKSRWICLGFYGFHPKFPGPLVEELEGKTFLLGIPQIDYSNLTPKGSGYEKIIFTNIIPMIRYIEYHTKESSTWCPAPSLTLPEVDTFSQSDGKLPWLSMKNTEREEVLDCVCGIPNEGSSGRISGGVPAKPYEFGWMTLDFGFKSKKAERKGEAFQCGGAIINDRLILTAAHCAFQDNGKLFKYFYVRTGAHHIDIYKDKDRATVLKVESVLIHPNFNFTTVYKYGTATEYNDIGALLVVEKLEFPKSGDGIRPICLPKKKEEGYKNYEGLTATVAGWGLISQQEPDEFPKVLQKLEVPIQPLKLCSDLVHKNYEGLGLICAGTLNPNKSSLPGDSGGPLMIQNDKKQWTEVGLVAFGKSRIGDTRLAVLYTNVLSYIDFIDYHSKRVGAQWCKSSP